MVLLVYFSDMKAFLVLLTVVKLSMSCTPNCICEEIETVCNIDDCRDVLPYFYTSKITIYGMLCDGHRTHLKSAIFSQTIIMLENDECLDLQFCL